MACIQREDGRRGNGLMQNQQHYLQHCAMAVDIVGLSCLHFGPIKDICRRLYIKAFFIASIHSRLSLSNPALPTHPRLPSINAHQSEESELQVIWRAGKSSQACALIPSLEAGCSCTWLTKWNSRVLMLTSTTMQHPPKR